MTTTNRNGDIDDAKLQSWREGMDELIRAGKFGPEKVIDFKHVEDIDCTPLKQDMEHSRHYICNILMKDNYDENVDVEMAIFRNPSNANISTTPDPQGMRHDNYGATYDNHSGQCELRDNVLKCWRQK